MLTLNKRALDDEAPSLSGQRKTPRTGAKTARAADTIVRGIRPHSLLDDLMYAGCLLQEEFAAARRAPSRDGWCDGEYLVAPYRASCIQPVMQVPDTRAPAGLSSNKGSRILANTVHMLRVFVSDELTCA